VLPKRKSGLESLYLGRLGTSEYMEHSFPILHNIYLKDKNTMK